MKTTLPYWWLLLLLLPFCALAQARYRPDSLLQILPHATGRARVEVLRHLSRAYIGGDTEKALGYAHQSVAEAEKLGNDTFLVRSLNNLAAAYQNSGDRRNSLAPLERAIGIARKNGNQIQLLEALEFKATAYAGMKQTDRALPFAQEALAISKTLRDSVGILNALEIIAAAHKDLNQMDEAVGVYRQEIALLEHLPKRLFEKGRVSVNLGEVLAKMGQKTEAIALFQQGKEYFEQFGYPVGALVAMLDLANSYLEAGQLAQAAQSYRDILEQNKAIGDPELNALAYVGLGRVATEQRHFPAASSHYQQAESAAQNARLHPALKEIYGHLNDLYCLQNDYQRAKTYKTLANTYADSLLSADVRDRLSELQVQYETAEKELQIAQQRSEIYRTNALNYGLGGSLLAFFGFGYLFYNRLRLRKKAELDAAVIREQKLGLNAVIEAQEAERKRIARDLHDGLAQELVALKLGFDALSRRIGKRAPEETPRFAALGEQLNDSCTEVRNIAHLMSPPGLEQQGLAPSLALLLRNTLSHTGLKANFEAHDLPTQLDEKTQIGLYRIAQELLNNVVKHARAAQVVVELFQRENRLVLRVEDDGIGYNFEEAREKGSMGLLNILSRAAALGGDFSAEKRTPRGTVAMVSVPV
jgi:signal transduction histidine kinase